MINIIPYQDDCLDFYEEVVNSKKNSKKDPHYKNRLSSYKSNITEQFKQHELNFSNNTLHKVIKHPFSQQGKTDLLKLYSYSSKSMKRLKKTLTTLPNNRISNICQNCTISEVNSFDHFINKEDFPEFSVHPKNLFPSCTKCNSYKGQEWRNSNGSTFLNLYLDTLPKEQYLFVEIAMKDNIPLPIFSIDNRNNINSLLFSRIKNHYDKLHLCERFQENVDLVISPLINNINMFYKKMPDEYIPTSKEVIMSDMNLFGNNYWQSILKMALLDSKEFILSIIND